MSDRIRVRVRPKENEENLPTIDLVKTLVAFELHKLNTKITELEKTIAVNKKVIEKVVNCLQELRYNLELTDDGRPTREYIDEVVNAVTGPIGALNEVLSRVHPHNFARSEEVENALVQNIARNLAAGIDDIAMSGINQELSEGTGLEWPALQTEEGTIARDDRYALGSGAADVNTPEAIVQGLSNPTPREIRESIHSFLGGPRRDAIDDLMDILSNTTDEVDFSTPTVPRRRRRR
jgi:hypothetical protein